MLKLYVTSSIFSFNRFKNMFRLSTILFFFISPFLVYESEGQVYEEPFEIRSIYFGGGSYYIDGKQQKEMIEWLDGFPNLNEYEIKIHGHTDNIGSLEYNRWLSKMRSEAVYQMLIRNEIPQEWVQRINYGEENPIFTNATWNGKLNNRRVDVILIPPSS
jgi:outer membrane protein OmpA-like peptidoglycan-associated protein